MADTKTVSGAAYSPAMDAKTHEQTYRGFVRFVEIATGVVICWVLALAVGVVAASAAGAIGALARPIGWKAPAVVGVLLALYLFFA